MKNIRQLFSLLCLSLLPIFAMAQTCNYALVMQDSWGDGWNGGSIDLDINGTVTNYTFGDADGVPPGGELITLIPVTDGDAITISYNAGNYATEQRYELQDATGAIVFEDGSVPCIDCEDDDMANAPVVGQAFTGTATCPNCTQPAATATVVPDCGNFQYSIDLDVTDLGDATSVEISTDVNGVEGTLTAAGSLQLGPFAEQSIVNISITHNLNTDCNFTLIPVSYTCPITACAAGEMATAGSVAVCPGGTFDLSSLGMDTIPNSPTQGGQGWFFDASQGGTGALGGSFNLTNAPNPAQYDEDLNGLLSANNLPPMGGTWVVSYIVFSDAANANTTVCAISPNSLTVNFLDSAPTAGTLTGGTDACYNSTLTATVGTAANAPAGTTQYYALADDAGTIASFGTSLSFDLAAIDFAAIGMADCGDLSIHSLVIDTGIDVSQFVPGSTTLGALSTAITFGIVCGDLDPTGTTFAVACDELTVTTSATPENCGDMAGTADATPAGGTPGYTYLWSDGTTTASLSGVGAGTYMVTVTDNIGCTAIEAVMVGSTGGPNSTIASTDLVCAGDMNGSVTVTPTAGASPYSYIWSNGATTQNLTGLAGGTYNVTVSDDNGCPFTTGAVINEPTEVDYIIDFANTALTVACNGDMTGALVITTSGGTAPYTFEWSNGATTEDITGLGAGFYQGTITDANGCMLISPNIPIQEPDLLGADIDFANTILAVACNGDMTGALAITTTGGTAPYTYIWSNGATTEDITGLGAGTYQGTLTDANGCVLVSPAIPVSEPDAITITETHEDEVGGNGAGAIDLSVNGGTAPFTAVWSDGITTIDRTGLSMGDYSATITDDNGCTSEVGPIMIDDVSSNKDIDGLNEFSIQPNPSNGMVYINLELDRAMDASFSLYTITGQLLENREAGKVTAQQFELDLTDYAAGVYMARFTLDGQTISRKIVLTK